MSRHRSFTKMENKMELEPRILQKYEILSAMPEISLEAIEELNKLLNMLGNKGVASILFCKQIAPMLFYWYSESKIWEIQEHELAIASFKNQIFEQNGELRESVTANIRVDFRTKRIAQIMFNANKLQFLGFQDLPTGITNQISTHYFVAVYCLSGPNGVAHFCINKNLGNSPLIQFTFFQRFTPQDKFCKTCEYFLGGFIAENRLTCAVQPDGPTYGFDGCIDYSETQLS
jgi:hypothetical protein